MNEYRFEKKTKCNEQIPMNKYPVNLEHTPCHIVRPVVDRDVVNAEDAGQVYPPGGSTLPVSRE